jgi:hypothetical protein
MPQPIFDCKPPKPLLYTTLRKSANRCRVFSFSSNFFKISAANPILGLPAHFGFDHWSVFIFFHFFKYPDCESFVFSTFPFIQDQLRFPIVAVQTPADIYQRGYQLAS